VKAPRFARLLVALSMVVGSCTRAEPTPFPGGGDRVPLAMRLVGDSVWELSYRTQHGESRLRVRPQIRTVPDSIPFGAATWTLYAVPGYSPRTLLSALATAHETPDTVTLASPRDSLPLDVALLAVNAARNSEGAFGRAGTGSWIAAKLFFADDEGEVYLNLNPARNEAEFGVKDPEYGPVVLRELGRLRSASSRESSNER